ncbi:MAG: SUMF1/EgtB/PvdO family nonheme iron enzyme [Phycisphaerales bacterium]|nr:MAG: SUMF1/EgtB/PvdO family nonheme iron enzyme [Phycisphaerales bacterium]
MTSYERWFNRVTAQCGLRLKHLVKYAALLAVLAVTLRSSGAPSRAGRPPREYTQTVESETGEKISFKMVLIEGGEFVMGSPQNEPNRADHEGPQRRVRIDPFYLCTTETTLELFLAYYQETVSAKKEFIETDTAEKEAQAGGAQVDAITGPTPVYGDLTMGYEATHPAMGATWHNAMTFCRWLSKKTGRNYRLPTEAEWEYACRAGGSGIFGLCSDPNRLTEYAWYDENADFENHGVAEKKPNPWGLYDMLGNVREWVYDFYSPDAYKNLPSDGPAVNPRGPESGTVHVARGGDYNSPALALRCAARTFEEKWWRSGDPQIPKSKWWLPEMDFIGFRVAASIDKSKGADK